MIGEMEIKTSIQLKILIIIWLLFSTVDFYTHKYTIKNSGDLTVFLQRKFKSFGDKIAFFFANPIIFLLFSIFLVLMITSNSRIFVLHKLFIIMITGSFLYWLKVLYKRDRPFLYNEQIKIVTCSCNHGMPSGHSAMSVTFIIIFDQWVQKVKPNIKNNKLALILIRIGLVLLASTIGFSRIIAGVHSYTQVLNGFLIGYIISEIFNENLFKEFLFNFILRDSFQLIGILSLIFMIFIGQLFYTINKKYRRDDITEWKYWDKCTKCYGSFDEEDMLISSTPVLLFIYFLGLHYNYKIFSHEVFGNSNFRENVENRSLFDSKTKLRILIYFLILGPFNIGILAFMKISEQKIDHEYNLALLKLIAIIIISFYSVFGYLILAPHLFAKFKLDYKSDYLTKEKSLENNLLDNPFDENRSMISKQVQYKKNIM